MNARMLTLATMLTVVCALSLPAEIDVDVPPQALPPKVEIPVVGSTVKKPAVPYASAEDLGARNMVPEETDAMTFMNGDRLHGRLLAVGPPDADLTWKHESVNKPIDFRLESVSEVKLATRPSRTRPHNAVVELTNGDLLTGNIVSMDAATLALETWYAGTLSIKRMMVSRFDPSLSTSPVAYEGPTALDSWTFGSLGNRQAWGLRNGTLVGKDPIPIGRNIEAFPDTADIAFDVAWQGSPYFYFSFYTDNLRQYSGNCYALRISSATAYLYRFERNTSSHNMGSVSIQQFVNDGSNRMRLSLLVDRKSKRFTLMINGALVKQWVETGPFVAAGKGILFHPRNQGLLKISNIRIAEWDGRTPQKTESSPKDGAGELVHFSNGDKVSGRLLSILDGQAKLETSYATLDIPLERMTRVEMSSGSQERARRNIGDVRAHFAERGSLTFKLSGSTEAEMTGVSENLGEVALPLEALRLVEFNIYEEKNDAGDDLL